MPAIECVIDYMADGGSFDASSGTSVWSILTRYLSQRNQSQDDGTFTLSEYQVLSAAQQIFSDLIQLPEIPEGMSMVERVEEQDVMYQFQAGDSGDHEITVSSCEGNTVQLIVDGGAGYEVTVNENGAIVSIT